MLLLHLLQYLAPYKPVQSAASRVPVSSDFSIQFFDHVFDKLHVFESLPDQKAVVVAHAMSFQGFNDLGNFRA